MSVFQSIAKTDAQAGDLLLLIDQEIETGKLLEVTRRDGDGVIVKDENGDRMVRFDEIHSVVRIVRAPNVFTAIHESRARGSETD